jgi:salicylate hydroxylase
MLERADPVGVWPILDVDHAERMVPRARIVLVGDAAHAMPPYAAQGAAMAIEDAWVLACQLFGSPPEVALPAFAALRAPRIAKVVKRVAFHRFVYHLPPPASWARNAAMAARSPASLRADLGWLYDWTAAPLGGGHA